jgi:hypothetical protein
MMQTQLKDISPILKKNQLSKTQKVSSTIQSGRKFKSVQKCKNESLNIIF